MERLGAVALNCRESLNSSSSTEPNNNEDLMEQVTLKKYPVINRLIRDVVPVVVGGLLATPLVHSLCYL